MHIVRSYPQRKYLNTNKGIKISEKGMRINFQGVKNWINHMRMRSRIIFDGKSLFWSISTRAIKRLNCGITVDKGIVNHKRKNIWFYISTTSMNIFPLLTRNPCNLIIEKLFLNSISTVRLTVLRAIALLRLLGNQTTLIYRATFKENFYCFHE